MLNIDLPPVITNLLQPEQSLVVQIPAVADSSDGTRAASRHHHGWKLAADSTDRVRCFFLAIGDALDGEDEVVEPEATGTDLTDPVLKKRAEQIISTFENSTTEIRYDYAENINDGRGITAGRSGFTSRTGDLLLVVEKYAELSKDSNPEAQLLSYVPVLREVNGTSSTEGLENFIADWAEAVKSDPNVTLAQDAVYNQLYFDPAMKIASERGITTALGQLIILDTGIQHGIGDDRDGLPSIIAETNDAYGSDTQFVEKDWLVKFLELRAYHLTNAEDVTTAVAWSESVSRVHALSSLVEANKMYLEKPLMWTVYGDEFQL